MSFMTLKNVCAKVLANFFLKSILMDFVCFSNLRARFCAFFFAFFFLIIFYRFSVNQVAPPTRSWGGVIWKAAWRYFRIPNGNVWWTPPQDLGGVQLHLLNFGKGWLRLFSDFEFFCKKKQKLRCDLKKVFSASFKDFYMIFCANESWETIFYKSKVFYPPH